MAIYEDLVSKARLKVFLDEIKKHFPISVNGKKQDSNGNIVIPSFGGASASSNGSSGVVPAPLKGTQNKFLKGDGTWDIVSIAGGGTGLTSSPSMLTNLGSTAAANVLQASPRPGVTGILPIANGGTGANTVAEAVQAFLGTSSIGSPTKPLYYDGAALKACADSIGGGGIVAQLLKQNGYAKFANGLILQWGVDYGRANGKQINYPIAFSKFAKVVALDGFDSRRINCYSSLYEEPSLTYFKFNYDSETSFVNWIAIGL
nr:MAG TPA: putative tail fiber protein [Caudoviricetes sp.]